MDTNTKINYIAHFGWYKHVVNTVAVDVPIAFDVRASAAMVLTNLFWNIPISAQEG